MRYNHLIVYRLIQDEDEHHFDEENDYLYRVLVDKHVLHYEQIRLCESGVKKKKKSYWLSRL